MSNSTDINYKNLIKGKSCKNTANSRDLIALINLIQNVAL